MIPVVAVPSTWAAAATRVAAQPRPDMTLEGVYRQLAPAVLGYFRARGVEDPEDLVGDVFVGVARGLRRFDGDGDALRRWVFTIAYRRLADDRRRRARRSEPVPVPPSAVTQDRSTSFDIDLVRALAALTEPQREVVLLRFVADLPLGDVARILRRRVDAVKALQSRGLDRLARQLSTCGADL
jgi:RNA polymerase sigma-70 factor (ECF subfamily)